jgi:hypothetical protein
MRKRIPSFAGVVVPAPFRSYSAPRMWQQAARMNAAKTGAR